jgi:uncharacterized membrane protein YfcA
MEFGYIVAGFVVGLLVGLTGVGGGSLMSILDLFRGFLCFWFFRLPL